MKTITEYLEEYIEDKVLNESLFSWFRSFIKKVHNNYVKRKESGNTEKFKIDNDSIKYNKTPLHLSEIDKQSIEYLNNKEDGFINSYNLIKNPKKFGYKDLSNLYMYEFFYNNENTYPIGILIYDAKASFKDNYKHISLIELNQLVQNENDTYKLILKTFGDTLNIKEKNIEGYTAMVIYPNFKKVLNILGFSPMEDNDKIYEVEK